MTSGTVTEAEKMKDRVLKEGIAEFYDGSSGVWERIWGDHMHHGFYEPGSTVSVSDHRAAQIRMIDEALRFAGLSGRIISPSHFNVHYISGVDLLIIPVLIPTYVLVPIDVNKYELSTAYFFGLNLFAEDPEKRPKNVLDVGCGIGGSSRYIARKYGATCQGITLSPVQAQRANALVASQGLADKVNLKLFWILTSSAYHA